MTITYLSNSRTPNPKLANEIYFQMIKEAEAGDTLAAYDAALCYLQGQSGFPLDYIKGEYYLKIVINNFDRTKLDDNQLITTYILLASITSYDRRHSTAKKYFAKAYDLSYAYYHAEQARKVLEKQSFFMLINDSGYDLDEIIQIRDDLILGRA